MTDVSYQLAAELSESGFPQGGSGSWVGDPAVVVMRSGDRVYVPTLSELIEACTERGDFRLQCSFEEPDYVRWQATFIQGIHGAIPFEGRGSHPEEAVARLWLALSRGPL